MVVRIVGGPSTGSKARRAVRTKPLVINSTQRATYSKPYVPPRPAPRPAAQRAVQQIRAQAPAPVYQPPAPVYRAPAPAPVYQPIQNFAPQNFGAPSNTGGGSFAGAAPVQNFAPPPPPRPARKIFNQKDWLAGDADYKEQMTEYDRALGAFRNRINAKKAEFDTDLKQSRGVTEQNQDYALDDLGEDFGARGLSYSGLFDKSRERTADNFRTQIANLVQMNNRNKGQADQELGQYSEEVNVSKRRALRNAIARMAQAQAISDAELGY